MNPLRLPILALGAAIFSTPLAVAGEPYAPIPLAPAATVTPPPDLAQAATALLEAATRDDRSALAAGLGEQLTLVDGPLELGLRRFTEIIDPFDTIELTLAALANNIGGIYSQPFDGSDVTPYAVAAEREFIIGSLTDGQSWGLDPLLEDAICTYAYRSYDRDAVTQVGALLGTQTSSFFFVEDASAASVRAEAGSPVAAVLEPDALYALDYQTDAPPDWIAVHLPEGGSGFVNFKTTEISKPYARGICFSKGADGRWVMSAQTATNL